MNYASGFSTTWLKAGVKSAYFQDPLKFNASYTVSLQMLINNLLSIC